MTTVALIDIAQALDVSHFESSWWFAPFGTDMDRVVAEILPSQMGNATETLGCAGQPGAVAFPMPSGEPGAKLLVWPDARGGLAILIAEHDGQTALTAMWPFTAEGGAHTISVNRLMIAPDRLQAFVEGVLEGGLSLTWLDPFFPVQRAFYAKGSRHLVLLTGIAHIFKIGAAEPVRVTPDNPNYQAVLQANPSSVGPDGSVMIQTAGMAAIFPLKQASPGMYSIQGPVKSVSYYEVMLFGRMAYKIEVVVARLGDAGATAVTLPIMLTDLVLQGGRLPTIGEDVSAAVRLQAMILEPNLQLSE